MEPLIPFLLLSICSYATSESLDSAVKRRSDFGIYASDYTRDYEPVAYVAIPLHSPLPVLHVMSSSPLEARDPKPGKHRVKSPHKPQVYASSMTHAWYSKPHGPTPQWYPKPQEWYPKAQESSPAPQAWYKSQPAAPTWYKPEEPTHNWYKPVEPAQNWYKPEEAPQNWEKPDETAPVILYARPNSQGGYSYSKKPTKKKVPPKRPVMEPVILRIHKYRIVRDR